MTRGMTSSGGLMLLTLATICAPCQAEGQQRPEVLTAFPVVFYGKGANSLEKNDPKVAVMTDSILRSDLQASGRFRLIPPEQLSRALSDTVKTGAECVSLECRRAISRKLGAQWMVTTKLSKTSNLIWYLSGQLSEVRSGRRLLDDEFELKGIAEDIAKGGAHSMARRIVAAVGKAAAPASTAARLDSATVRSRLAAATDSTPPDFSKTDLSGLNLSGVDFKRANLSGARLVGTKLAGANLFTVDLTDAVLTNADLARANLDGTVLRRANFQGADLEGASMFATIVESADLANANLSGARIIGYLRGAKLGGASLRHANAGADPGNQSMRHASHLRGSRPEWGGSVRRQSVQGRPVACQPDERKVGSNQSHERGPDPGRSNPIRSDRGQAGQSEPRRGRLQPGGGSGSNRRTGPGPQSGKGKI